MRITFVFHTIGKYGGAEKVVVNLCNQFATDGHSVTLVQLNSPKKEIYQLDKKVISVAADSACRIPVYKSIKRFMKLKSLIKRSQPDVIVSFLTFINITTTLIAKSLKIPVVISERSDPHRSPENLCAKILRPVVYPLADGFVFQTKEARDFFNQGIRERAEIIPNPVLCEIPNKDSLNSSDVVIVGRMIDIKNHSMALYAFEKFLKTHEGYKLHFFGNGPEEDSLKHLAADLNISDNVIFHGFTMNVPDIIKGAGLFLLTSNVEGMPNALMEAMALGIPCISTDCPCGGPASLIEDGTNGFLIKVNDVEALLNKMNLLANDKSLAQKISLNAIQSIQNYSLGSISNKWVDYLNRVIKRNI